MQQYIYIKTFGCQMNEYDSLRMQKILEPHGYKPVAAHDDASVIVLNTCSVRQKAQDKVYSALGRIRKLKKRNPHLIVAVGGCLAQQEGTSLIRRFPFVNIVFGAQALRRLPLLLQSAISGEQSVDIAMDSSGTMYPAEPYTLDPSSVSAFVTIMQGCNNCCSYCIVPYVRGPEWSRPAAEIVEEVTQLVAGGAKEITLLGQNVNSYGKSLPHNMSFSRLLEMLNDVKGLERIRFTTSHPRDLSATLIESCASLAKVCEHVHLPVQSGSNSILHKMNRKYTREEYLAKVAALRKAMPEISITSDIITGFPGETEADFQQTRSLVEGVGFDDLFLFHYTDRPGTAASGLSQKVPYPDRIRRLSILKDIQTGISRKKNSRMVGASVPVLFEGRSKRGDGSIAGRTRSNKVVNCEGPEALSGTTRTVVILKANVHSLAGSILPDGNSRSDALPRTVLR